MFVHESKRKDKIKPWQRSLRPFHIYTETEPKTEKLKCLNTYECFHICAKTEPKSVSVAEFQHSRQVI